MGSAEPDNQQLIIFPHIITYGNAADTSVTENMREKIETANFITLLLFI